MWNLLSRYCDDKFLSLHYFGDSFSAGEVKFLFVGRFTSNCLSERTTLEFRQAKRNFTGLTFSYLGCPHNIIIRVNPELKCLKWIFNVNRNYTFQATILVIMFLHEQIKNKEKRKMGNIKILGQAKFGTKGDKSANFFTWYFEGSYLVIFHHQRKISTDCLSSGKPSKNFLKRLELEFCSKKWMTHSGLFKSSCCVQD